MDELFIPVLLGTSREGRKSETVAKYVVKAVNEREGLRSELVDPRELNLPGDGNNEGANDLKYSEITKNADAFIIVTPEYNHSFPGSLKRMLDSEYNNYVHKPVSLVGVSAGRWGGVRAIESLVPVLRELGMAVTLTDVMVAGVGDAFDENGEPKSEHLRPAIEAALDELAWYAKTLNWGKENLPNKYHQHHKGN